MGTQTEATVTENFLAFCKNPEHRTAYSCARCNHVYCCACDHASKRDEVKTMVRWCQDYRCQREEKIERGELDVMKRRMPTVTDDLRVAVPSDVMVVVTASINADDYYVPVVLAAGQRFIVERKDGVVHVRAEKAP